MSADPTRPRDIPFLRAIVSYLSGPCRLPRLRPLIIAFTTLALLTPAAPALADTGGTSDFSVSGDGLGFSSGTDAWDLVNSNYSLDDMNPLSQVMTGQSLGDTLSSNYITQTDLAENAQLALDQADLARRAQAEAEAKRMQALSSAAHLKPGAVPDQYVALVESADSQYCSRLPLGVFAAQLAQESGWNPRALSPQGAEGIAQFMPSTWAGAGIDANHDGKADIWDPADAIPSAAKYDCSIMDAVNSVPGDPVSNTLAAYNAGVGAVKSAGGVPAIPETQNYVKTILAKASDMVVYDSGTGPQGCPTSSPAGTIRGSATRYTIAQICADSVSQARTPQAAAAIKYALNHLGDPYSQPLRNREGYYDCSSFVSRSYQAAGVNIAPPGQNAPVTTTFAKASWSPRESLSQARPGDWIEPESGHIYMYLAHNLIAEASHDGDVTHVTDQYSSSPYAVGWVDPTQV